LKRIGKTDREGTHLEKVKDIYIKLLLGAIIIFAIGATYILSDLYDKVGSLDHDVMHLKGMKKAAVCAH
jgi:hypothetical protein